MAAEQAKIIEQLMGSNLSNFSSRGQVQFTDRKVCRSFLCGICPHDVFVNTKMDLGPCPKIHSDKLKADYEAASYSHDYGYEWDYLQDLERHVTECNKRIDIAEARREKTREEIDRTDALMKEILHLDHTISVLIDEIKALASKGRVNESIQRFTAYNKVKQTKKELVQEVLSINELPSQASSTHQKLQVCDVCSAYLSRLDNDRRLADHFSGKMHLGYAQIRDAAKELRQLLEKRELEKKGELTEEEKGDRLEFQEAVKAT
ncbi:U1 snRNP-associated protein Usp106 [Schizosaccharomyces japonicus yFS275]|uniref:U1 snRNP-associated protein Usp106 n=1 Tax=Schizosaccharomyces japonicus (strain yFS275 / FY16936) TaxID=402676 RepID=B6K686_SCHJY|nr:U1 snRNP-associated protein Usp106 [Schizosaccharomyces japonicus yFS275]EEB09040.1 U1 snRNP-associated protein Usp106 [Schizosaccharomyces japonicus yFS275]